MNSIYIDLDGTLCPLKEEEQHYEDLPVRADVVERLHQARENGFRVVVHTARNMRTFSGDLVKIEEHTGPIIRAWLKKRKVPYDGLILGKPWPGARGFYVDDRTVRPDEFTALDIDEIHKLLGYDR